MWAGGLSKHHTFTSKKLWTGVGVGSTITCQPNKSTSWIIEFIAIWSVFAAAFGRIICPPLSTVSPPSQNAVAVLEPRVRLERGLSTTLYTLEEISLSPGAPCGPCVPLNPLSPCIPRIPCGPGGPCSPCRPWIPWGPAGPGGPCVPVLLSTISFLLSSFSSNLRCLQNSTELIIVTWYGKNHYNSYNKRLFPVVHYRIPTSNDYRTNKQYSRKLTKLIFLNSLNNFTKWI